jgi:hypothetical protein
VLWLWGLARPSFVRLHDNTVEVNEHLRATPAHFCEAMEDGIRHEAASALAVVHFHFSDLVDISEVAEGFPRGTRDSDMVLLMPWLEGATDTVLEIALMEAVLRGPSPSREG